MDLLASEYGWAKREILEDTYIDELILLQKKIKQRNISEIKTQLIIAQNPHVKNPKEIWKILDQEEERKPQKQVFDQLGFDRLRGKLANSAKIIVK